MSRRLIPLEPEPTEPAHGNYAGLVVLAIGLTKTAISSFAVRTKELFRANVSKSELHLKAGQGVNEPAGILFFNEIAEIDRQSNVINTQKGTLENGVALFDRVHVADRPAFLLACNDVLSARQNLKVRMQQPGQVHFCVTEISLQFHLERIFVAINYAATPTPDFDQNDQSRELAHELRTPLAAIVGLAEVLSQDQLCNEEMRRTYPALIASAGRTLIEMAGAVLHPQDGKLEIASVALSSVTKDCLAMLQPLARQKSISLFDRLPSTLASKAVEGPAMRQILTNLLSNAIKFSPENASVEVTAATAGNGWVLKVTDNGLGLSPEDVARLGQKNFRSDRTAGIAGHGLGLSIVSRLVDKIGGHISFESRPGKGTQVAISFPGKTLVEFPPCQFPAEVTSNGQPQFQNKAGAIHAAA